MTGGEANPRFIVTSLKRSEAAARHLYEKIYCARGDMENRIKECQLDLFADRTSTATMQANQLRLWFASMAYVLLCGLRRIGLAHTQFAEATCGTIRLKLLKLARWFGSACGGSRSPWRRLARGRTRLLWRMPDCGTRSPDTNRTGHSRHIDPAKAAEIAAGAELGRNSAFCCATQGRAGIRYDIGM